MPIDETFKTIMPWITGGLAGAILTLLSKFWAERRQQKRLSINTATTPFALPVVKASIGPQPEDLQVTYKGVSYDDLFLYFVVAKNIGNRSVEGVKLVLQTSPSTKVLDIFTHREPVSGSSTHTTMTTAKAVEHQFSLPLLEKNDSWLFRYVISPSIHVHVRLTPRESSSSSMGYEHTSDMARVFSTTVLSARRLCDALTPWLTGLPLGEAKHPCQMASVSLIAPPPAPARLRPGATRGSCPWRGTSR